jgi:hypothetical protein
MYRGIRACSAAGLRTWGFARLDGKQELRRGQILEHRDRGMNRLVQSAVRRSRDTDMHELASDVVRS